MKLTTEQIDYVFDYVAFSWYQMVWTAELTDHMVNSMEFWKRSWINFSSGKKYAEDQW
jgi:hypothetical protein